MLAALLIPLVILAQEPASPQARISEADARLAALDDEGARALAAPLVDDPTVPANLRAQAALRVGLAEVNLLHPDRATTAFKQALGADPTISLPADAQPKAVELFNTARAELATARQPPPPLPAKTAPPTEPALGWVRPTSFAMIAAGGVMLVAGAGIAMTGAVARWWLDQVDDPTQRETITRALFPIAVLAVGAILLSIPVAGTGLGLFFLSGEDGPLRDKRPDNE